MNLLAIGIGAGLVSALLFGAVITGSPLALLLSVVAPLPVFIAALGWSHLAGLVAGAAGAVAMALALNVTAGIAFGIGWALPAWWLAYLALLGRPAADGIMEWYPLGRLLLWIVGTSALITIVGVVAIGDGSYEAFQQSLQGAFEAFLRGQEPGTAGGAPVSNEAFVSFVVGALPFLFAFNFVMILALNLWLAGRAVQISGRLPRPRPYIPATAMPKAAIGLVAASIAASFLPGFAGTAGLALAGGLLAALALQGLTFIHETSRRRPGRALLLGGVYVLTLAVGQVVLPLLAILGLTDVAFSLRNRFRSGAAGPESPPSTT